MFFLSSFRAVVPLLRWLQPTPGFALFATLAGLLLWSPRALAEGGVLHLDLGTNKLPAPAEDLRRAVQEELGVVVVLDPQGQTVGGVLQLRIRTRVPRLMLSFSSEGQHIERAIKLPRRPKVFVETVALMAGNLARNEAGQLIADLRPAPPAPLEPPSTPDPPPVDPTTNPTETESSSTLASEPAPSKTGPNLTRKHPTKPPSAASQAPAAPAAPEVSVFNLSLFHPVALLPDSHERRVHLELGLAYSHVGWLHGIGVNILAARAGEESRGALVGGVWAHAKRTSGLAAGGIGTSGGDLQGVDVAGATSLRLGRLDGLQASGAFNLARGGGKGAQIAGAANIAGEPLQGAQVSPINVNPGLEGAQLGAVNLSRDLRGVQFGVINVGRDVRGAQVGLINVARSVKGLPFGLLNIIAKNRTQLALWSGFLPMNLGVKTHGDPMYSMLGAGYDPWSDRAAVHLSIGVRIPWDRVFFEIENQYLYRVATSTGFREQGEGFNLVLAHAGLSLVKGVELFAGGGVGFRADREFSSPPFGTYSGGVQFF